MSLFCLLLLAACDSFDSPPQASLTDAVDGTLTDPSAPLRISFHEVIDPSTLRLEVIRFNPDNEGRLGDEDDDPATNLEVLFAYDPSSIDAVQPTCEGFAPNCGGEGTLDPGNFTFTANLFASLPIGARLAVIIEPGLRDLAGNEWVVRQKLVFGVKFDCGEAKATKLPNAFEFLAVDVEKPVGVQLQLLADVQVDPATGAIVGQFTNADRDASQDCSEFGLSCLETEVCKTLPRPACGMPSDQAGSADEWPDFVANATPPTGYSFTIIGCVRDQSSGTFAFTNAPADVHVESPPVDVKGILFNVELTLDGETVRGEGTFTAQDVLIGGTPSGSASGTMTLVSLAVDEVPGGIPAPPFGPDEIPDELGAGGGGGSP